MKRRTSTSRTNGAPRRKAPPQLIISKCATASTCDATIAALNALPAQIAVLDKAGIVIAVNNAWREFGSLSDRPTDRADIGEDYFAAIPADGAHFAEVALGVKAVLRGERKEFQVEYPCRVGGEEKWFHARVTPCTGATSGQAVIAHEDISERVRLEREIVAATAREQQRFRQELHDGLSQQLTGLKFKASLLEYHLQSKHLPEASEAKALSQLLNEATEEAANLARRMRPVEVEARGLMMALRELGSTTEQSHDVTCTVQIRRPVLIYDNNTATNLYRIAEEAVSNAITDGEAGRIHIALTEAANLVTLTVRDNGKAMRERGTDGLGPHLIRYHARIIGGTLDWRRESSGGVSFTCSFQKPAPMAKA